MASDIKHFFSESIEASALAETLAKEAFVAAHPEARLPRAKLRADEQDRFVVIVSYGPVATPTYACYAVSKTTRDVVELVDAGAYLPKR